MLSQNKCARVLNLTMNKLDETQIQMIADAFETSVTWSNYQKVLDNYYKTVYDAYEKLGYEKRLTYHCFRIA